MISYSQHLQRVTTRKRQGQLYVFCTIRKKWLVSSPEEVVRQAAIYFLVSLGYSANHISVEKQINFHQLTKRYDIVVSNRNGQHLILVECKAPQYPLKQLVLDQAGIYNMVVGGQYIWITNGHENRVYEIDHENQTSKEIDYIPSP